VQNKKKEEEDGELWVFLKISKITFNLLIILFDQSLNHLGKV